MKKYEELNSKGSMKRKLRVVDREQVKLERIGENCDQGKKSLGEVQPWFWLSVLVWSCVWFFLAEFLKADMELYNAGNLYKISLEPKWWHSLDSSYNKATLNCESISRKVFPRETYTEYQDMENAHCAFKVRDRLRKEVPLYLIRSWSCQGYTFARINDISFHSGGWH